MRKTIADGALRVGNMENDAQKAAELTQMISSDARMNKATFDGIPQIIAAFHDQAHHTAVDVGRKHAEWRAALAYVEAEAKRLRKALPEVVVDAAALKRNVKQLVNFDEQDWPLLGEVSNAFLERGRLSHHNIETKLESFFDSEEEAASADAPPVRRAISARRAASAARISKRGVVQQIRIAKGGVLFEPYGANAPADGYRLHHPELAARLSERHGRKTQLLISAAEWIDELRMLSADVSQLSAEEKRTIYVSTSAPTLYFKVVPTTSAVDFPRLANLEKRTWEALERKLNATDPDWVAALSKQSGAQLRWLQELADIHVELLTLRFHALAPLLKLKLDAPDSPALRETIDQAVGAMNAFDVHAAAADMPRRVELLEALQTSVKAVKVAALASYRLPLLAAPEQAVVVVFGSRDEVPAHLASTLCQWLALQRAPLLISGKEHETTKITSALRGVTHGEMHVDGSATSTESNALWTTAKLTELNLQGRPVVLFTFPVLARSAVDALVAHGVAATSIYPAFALADLDPDLLALADGAPGAVKGGWVDDKLLQAQRGKWAGKSSSPESAVEVRANADPFTLDFIDILANRLLPPEIVPRLQGLCEAVEWHGDHKRRVKLENQLSTSLSTNLANLVTELGLEDAHLQPIHTLQEAMFGTLRDERHVTYIKRISERTADVLAPFLDAFANMALNLARVAAPRPVAAAAAAGGTEQARAALLRQISDRLGDEYKHLISHLSTLPAASGDAAEEIGADEAESIKALTQCWEALFDCMLECFSCATPSEQTKALASRPLAELDVYAASFSRIRDTFFSPIPRLTAVGSPPPSPPNSPPPPAGRAFPSILMDHLKAAQRNACGERDFITSITELRAQPLEQLRQHIRICLSPGGQEAVQELFQSLTITGVDEAEAAKWAAIIRAKALRTPTFDALAVLWLWLSAKMLTADLDGMVLADLGYAFVREHLDGTKRARGAGASSGAAAAAPVEMSTTGSTLYVQSMDLIMRLLKLRLQLTNNAKDDPEPSRAYSRFLSHLSNSELSARIPDALRMYSSYLHEMQNVRLKHRRGPYQQEDSNMTTLEDKVLGKLQRLVMQTADASHTAAADVLAETIEVHLEAVKAARDFCTTYSSREQPHQPRNPSSDGSSACYVWQCEEWAACGRILDLCSSIRIVRVNSVEQHKALIEALNTSINVFPHLVEKKINIKKNFLHADQAEEQRRAKAHFESVLEGCEAIFGPEYLSLEAFRTALKQLQRHIDFNLSMPSITLDEAMSRFQLGANADHAALKAAYTKYEEKRKLCTSQWLTAGTPIATILTEVKTLAAHLRDDELWKAGRLRTDTLPELLATLSFLFTLHVSQMIAGATGAQTVRNLPNGLQPLKMHIVQVLGVLNLLGASAGPSSTQNQLAEVLTGQGKSWVLLMHASVLAVTGHDVRILCHNESLTHRDEEFAKPFIGLLRLLFSQSAPAANTANMLGEIVYATYEQTCWDLLKSTISGNARPDEFDELMRRVVDRQQPSSPRQRGRRTVNAFLKPESTVLLIDEVDVLFGPMYGQLFNPSLAYDLDAMARLQKVLWEKSSGTANLTEEAEAEKRIILRAAGVDTELINSNLFKNQISQLVAGCRLARTGEQDDAFRIGDVPAPAHQDRKVECKSTKLDGGEEWSSKTLAPQYLNALYYLKWQLPREQRGLGHYGYLDLRLGRMSYAVVPTKFKWTFGVTGSLSTLTDAEKAILRKPKEEGGYNLDSEGFSYFPSFWGERRRLDWDEADLSDQVRTDGATSRPPNFKLLDTESEVIDQCVHLVRWLLERDRCVLIFCRDTRHLQRALAKVSAAAPRVHVLDSSNEAMYDKPDSTGKSRKDLIIDNWAGEPGVVTLCTSEYTRGEDFKMSPAVIEKGGGHVLQLYLNKLVADDVQARGRVARKNEPGSYTLLLSWDDVSTVVGQEPPEAQLARMDDGPREEYKAKLARLRDQVDLLKARSESAKSKYRELDQLRKERAATDFEVQKVDASKAKHDHEQSMLLLDGVREHLSGKQGAPNRKSILEQLASFNPPYEASGRITGVDLCILMDCTQSMGPYIHAAKETINAVVEDTKRSLLPDGNGQMRVAYVGYRDFSYDDDRMQAALDSRFIIHPFGTDVSAVRRVIEGGEADGGGDIPEDVAGGLQEVNRLQWRPQAPGNGQLNLTIMVADDPAHGAMYEEEDRTSEASSLKDKLWMRQADGTFVQVNNAEYPDAGEELVKLLDKSPYFFFFACKVDQTHKMHMAFQERIDQLPNADELTYEQVELGGCDTNLFRDRVVGSVERARDMLVGRARG